MIENFCAYLQPLKLDSNIFYGLKLQTKRKKGSKNSTFSQMKGTISLGLKTHELER